MIVIFSKQAAKAVNSMDNALKQRIKHAITQIPQGDIKPLRGAIGHYRLRVGAWRVLFSYDENDTIRIKKIAPRGDAYKGEW